MFFSNDNIQAEIVGVFKIRRTESIHFTAVKRQYDSLSIRTDGNGTFTAEGKQYHLKTGDFIYLPQTADYTQETTGETVIAVHFINYNAGKKETIEAIRPADAQKAQEMMAEMYTLWTEKKAGYKQECTSYFYHLLYLFRKQTDKDAVQSLGADRMLRNAVDFMHKNYRREHIVISKLATDCAMSEVYFRKIFKNIYGVSPARYILNLKLEYAASLLQSGLYTVAETAEKSGFSDAKYFARQFKAHYNCPPRDYARLNLERLFL
ncbi:MAG: helix-turn-helix domain-containing protein [Clostridia bacterium]|nr:helix-turn-helix domain-containing protein [Clostridia bacterium]